MKWVYFLEIFQDNQPVLAGVDARSTYCFLLEEVEYRDEDTSMLLSTRSRRKRVESRVHDRRRGERYQGGTEGGMG